FHLILLITCYASYSATLTVYVDNTYVSDGSTAYTGVSSIVKCQAALGEYIYPDGYFYLKQMHEYTSDTELASIKVSDYNHGFVVYLQGIVNRLSLRCVYQDLYVNYHSSFAIIPERDTTPLAP
ncbi:hypothetical protein, partial [Salmonella sp. s54836]|uniref:hypothetical protein n=1 Tax=Salmonella sp. s54836 TaxID=3159673 RepID=UPI0039816A6F